VRDHRGILGAVAGLAAGVVVLLLVLVLVGTYSTVTAIRATQGDSRRTLSLIESCTTPNGACTQAGNQRTSDAIDAIVGGSARLHRVTRRYAIVAAACADHPGPQTTRQITACIRQEIQR
jgi:hypothetical protein